MTTSSGSDRLDRIENDLEAVKDILLTVARRYEVAADRREATDERIDRLVERQERTQAQLDQLREDVDIAFQTIKLMSENADRDRAEFRTESRQIWEYLMQQYRNGNGDRPQS